MEACFSQRRGIVQQLPRLIDYASALFSYRDNNYFKLLIKRNFKHNKLKILFLRFLESFRYL